MFADFMNIQSQASAQIPSYVPQRYMREDTQGYGINAIEETQQWYAQKMELSVAPISLSIPPTTTIFPDVPQPIDVINENLPKDEEIPAESKEDQPTSSPKASRPKSRFEGMKKMETIYGPPPFPQRFANQLNSLRNREVNIPSLDEIAKVPRYATFLKELCTTKSEFSEKFACMNENISAAYQRKLHHKCKDLGSFSIPCKIGKNKIENAMCEFGSPINIIPYSI